MSRLHLLLILACSTAQTSAAGPDSTRPQAALSRITTVDEVSVPPVVLDSAVRGHRAFRNAVQGAVAKVASVAGATSEIPDLTVLTAEPVSFEHLRRDRGEPSSGYGWRDDPIRHRAKFHSGADFRASPGTPVVAAGAGVVVFSGRRGGYGNVVFVDHGGGLITRYAHLRRIETTTNASVVAGQQIGQVGSTGRVTGPHLHFEVRFDGRPLDPITALRVGHLQRENPAAARELERQLTPEAQANEQSEQDPPRTRPRTKRARPVS
ncbi:MAG: M23 family metallopeptidase [Kofleriaceae bacterium]